MVSDIFTHADYEARFSQLARQLNPKKRSAQQQQHYRQQLERRYFCSIDIIQMSLKINSCSAFKLI